MTSLSEATEAKFRELAQSLKPAFGEDSRLVARSLTMNLRASFGGDPDTLSAQKQGEYLAALNRLPKGGKTPLFPLVSRYDRDHDPHFKVLFRDDLVTHESVRRFQTEAEADDYATKLLRRLHGEIDQE